MNGQIRVPEEFLEILRQNGVSLESEGVHDVALMPEVALQAIHALRGSQIGIIGGEVWQRNSQGRFIPTYDIWDLNKADYHTVDEFLLQSWDIAEKQVTRYLNFKDIVIILSI